MAGPNRKKKKDEETDDVSFIDVELGGKPHRIERLNMDDAEWADVKKTAEEKKILKVSHDNMADATANAAEKNQTAEVSASNRAREDAFVKEKADKEMIEVQDKDGNKYSMRRGDQDKLDAGKLRDQVKKLEESKSNEGGGGTMGGAFRSIASKLFEGATPQKKSAINVDDLENGFGESNYKKTSVQVDAGQPKITSRVEADPPQPVEMQPMLPNRGPDQPTYTPKGAEGFADVLRKGVDGVLNTGNGADMYMPDPQPAQAEPPPAGGMLVDMPPVQPRGYMENSTPQKDGTMKDDLAAVPPNGSMSVSSSVKGMGGTPLPELEDRRAEFDASHKAMQDAQMKLAQHDKETGEMQVELARKGQIDQLQMQEDDRRATQASQKFVQDKQSAYAKTVEEAEAPNKVDPNRWWSERNTAQKIFAVLSAGLTRGATLSMFQHAIDRDVEAQQHDISNTRMANQAKAAGQHNIYNMARQNGMDEHESRIVATAQAWKNVENASKIAGMSAKSQSVILAAQEQAAMANGKHIEELQKMDNYQQTNAMEKKKLSLLEMQTAAQVRKLQEGAGGGHKPGKGLMNKPAADLADLETGKEALKDLIKDVGSPNYFTSIWRKVTDGKGPGGVDLIPWGSDAKNINSKVKLVIQKIAPGMGSGTLQAGDIERWDAIMGAAGDLSQEKRLANVLKDVEMTLANRKKGFKQSGVNMDGYEGGTPPTTNESDAFGMLENQ